jgi:DNA-directed RNA polymerase specialized sigma24 family protein
MRTSRCACASHQENPLDSERDIGIEELLPVADPLKKYLISRYPESYHEMIHDVIIDSVRKVAKKFNSSHSKANLKAYLRVTVERTMINALKKRDAIMRGGEIQVVEQRSLEAHESAHGGNRSFEEMLPPTSSGQDINTKCMIASALGSLSSLDQELVTMKLYQKMTVKDIHNTVPNTKSLKTTERWVTRAVSNFRNAIRIKQLVYR